VKKQFMLAKQNIIMGFLSWLLRHPKKAEALEALQSLPSSASIATEIPKEQPKIFTTIKLNQSSPSTMQMSPTLHKDSYQLGLAAGYTGRSIKNIEESLNRIESGMVSKDWFKTEFEDATPQLIQGIQSIRFLIQEHESNDQKRFEAIQESLNRMSNLARTAPEPIKEELFREIQAIESQIPLSPKMQQLISVVKEQKEISYDDLGVRLTITVSALRGLLSNLMKRTNEIERFAKDGKGWVRYKGD